MTLAEHSVPMNTKSRVFLAGFLRGPFGLSLAFALGCSLGAWLASSAGRWMPTGDGRTIVNIKTGELRRTLTGESVGSTVGVNAESLALENGRHYHAIQGIVLTTADSELAHTYSQWSTGWRSATEPFRDDAFPTESRRNVLATTIAELQRRGDLSGEKWRQLYDHLRALRYDGPEGVEMKRTPEQAAESRRWLLGR